MLLASPEELSNAPQRICFHGPDLYEKWDGYIAAAISRLMCRYPVLIVPVFDWAAIRRRLFCLELPFPRWNLELPRLKAATFAAQLAEAIACTNVEDPANVLMISFDEEATRVADEQCLLALQPANPEELWTACLTLQHLPERILSHVGNATQRTAGILVG